MSIFNIVLIIILILIVIYVLSMLFTDGHILYDKLLTLDGTTSSGTNHIIEYNKNKSKLANTTSTFTISVWFYIEEWSQAEKNRNILYINNTQINNIPSGIDYSLETVNQSRQRKEFIQRYRNFNILLDKYRNDILVDVITTNENNSNELLITRYRVNNVPIQKWNCLTISVDTKTMDIYLGGKLVKSYILPGIYISSEKNNIYLGKFANGNSFKGYITRVRYMPYFINPQESYEIYINGIKSSRLTNIFSRYALKFSFMENDDEKTTFFL